VSFVFLGFPWDRVRDALAVQASRDDSVWRVDRARLRPAWSPAWLRGEVALAVDLAGPEGRVRGTLYAGSAPGFEGRVEDVVLASLPLAGVVADLALDGTADAEIDLRSGDDGPQGSVALAAADGSIALPGMPVALPYAFLEGELELGGDALLRVHRLVLDGPMISVEGEGTVGRGADVDRAALDVRVHVEVHEASVRPMIRNLGVRLDREGRGDARIGGTLSRPAVR
jgi:type II secretion system protein N